jgi:hypothetical protein
VTVAGLLRSGRLRALLDAAATPHFNQYHPIPASPAEIGPWFSTSAQAWNQVLTVGGLTAQNNWIDLDLKGARK